MKTKTKTRMLLAAALLLLIFVIFVAWPRSRDDGEVTDDGSVAAGSQDDSVGSAIVGGVRRPLSDFGGESSPKATWTDISGGYGAVPKVPIDANPQVAAVAKVILNRKEDPKKYASAVSVLGKPTVFEADRYRDDNQYRKKYLETVEPSRAFNPAQPGDGVARLGSLSPREQDLVQGEKVFLRISAAPKSPVSFTTTDLGFFDNQLTSITVESDESGVAEVSFLATTGVIGRSNVIVASPQSSGQVRFAVNVILPE